MTDTNIFPHSYDVKYSYLTPMICKQLHLQVIDIIC